jgi:hypothetical protein
MFDEEFFVSVLPTMHGDYVFKYHSETQPGLETAEVEPTGENTISRGNLLGATLVSQSPWTAPDQVRH